MSQNVFFDRKDKRLVFLMEHATPDFWDRHWNTEDLQKEIMKGTSNGLVKYWTQKYLAKGACVLEGGCGHGAKVYGLKKWGYDSYGVDFATQTIQKIHDLFPDLNVSVQDVRSLSFTNDFFDGYWSFGVIEHFYDGYENIIQEANRVLRPCGVLFLTFPVMSPIRKLKSILGLYPVWNEQKNKNSFYQFALSSQLVVEEITKIGFTLCEEKNFDGVKGLKDEVVFLKRPLQSLYDRQSFLSKCTRTFLGFFLNAFTSHSVLLVFKKNEI